MFRLSAEGAIAALLVGVLVSTSSTEWRNANTRLGDQLSDQKSQIAALQSQVADLQTEVQDLKERWYGAPAVWQPPAIANTDINYFDVTGGTQYQLIDSLNSSSICDKYGSCAPDPANPNGIAWGLESEYPAEATYHCYSPRTTTVPYREFIVLPRWSPPPDGSVKIPLVEKWNALAQVIYTHEAGHVTISQQDIAALNDQAHQLPSCQAVFDFWSNPSIWDKLNADQAAYHVRLRADCRPEIGCLRAGWMGW